MLKLRILTAAVLILAVFLGILFLPPVYFQAVALFVILLGAWEWAKLIGISSPIGQIAYLGLIVLCFFLSKELPVDGLLFGILLLWIVAGFWISCYPKGKQKWSDWFWLRMLAGILVLVPCALALNVIRSYGIIYVFLLLMLVCGADTGAYFAGRFWGSRKLAPSVSPGKTVEGLYGGLLFSLAVAVSYAYLAHIHIQFPWFFLVAIFTVLLSVLGDLFESLVKREAGVKDSGTLLPGHGGVLDRIDSLTAAAPGLAVGLWLIQ